MVLYFHALISLMLLYKMSLHKMEVSGYGRFHAVTYTWLFPLIKAFWLKIFQFLKGRVERRKNIQTNKHKTFPLSGGEQVKAEVTGRTVNYNIFSCGPLKYCWTVFEQHQELLFFLLCPVPTQPSKKIGSGQEAGCGAGGMQPGRCPKLTKKLHHAVSHHAQQYN